jgi:hypothetical protein
MAPKYHAMPLFGGDRKAHKKELGRARAMTTLLVVQARAKGEALIKQADRPWLQIECTAVQSSTSPQSQGRNASHRAAA